MSIATQYDLGIPGHPNSPWVEAPLPVPTWEWGREDGCQYCDGEIDEHGYCVACEEFVEQVAMRHLQPVGKGGVA